MTQQRRPIANSSDVTLLLFQTPVVTPFLQNHPSDSPCPQHTALTTLTTSSAFQDPISLQAHLLPPQLSRACVLTLLPSSHRSSPSSPSPTHNPPTTSSPPCPPAGRPVSRASSPTAPIKIQRTPLLYARASTQPLRLHQSVFHLLTTTGVCGTALAQPSMFSSLITCVTDNCNAHADPTALTVPWGSWATACNTLEHPLPSGEVQSAEIAVATGTASSMTGSTTASSSATATSSHATGGKGSGDGSLVDLANMATRQRARSMLGLTVGIVAGVVWF